MKIAELFRRPIDRRIEEVIKVDDETTVLGEVEEYIATAHIADELVEVLNAFQETINSPNEGTNVWVSGFFGSGKSSFAKVLGYLLANPVIGGTPVADRFFELNEIPRAKALLNTIHSQAPAEVVLLDLSQSTNVLSEGEPVVLPVYRALLSALGYSRDITLAELEFGLEGRGELDRFAEAFERVNGRTWESSRDVILAKSEASRTLHEIDPETYPAADSWAVTVTPPEVNENWFADRALEMLTRRRPDTARLVFVVDEVGQYVARSTTRLLHLGGLAQAMQKKRGRLWLVVTSQEALSDVVDSLEGKQVELARVIDRFPVKVDLLPSDIDEVTGKRVLEKNAAGDAAVRAALDADRNRVTASVTLQSNRHYGFSDDDFARLYPLVPYQLQLLIDAVSARRAQGGAPQTLGGSNRTIIKHAQQLITNAQVGLADEPVGALVTLDRSYSLLEEVIPTAWRHEVDQVATAHGSDSTEACIMRVVALCTGVPGIPLNARNLSVLLHPSMSSDPIEPQVRDALAVLVKEDRLRESDNGYELQSPEQKDWEKTRRGIELKPGDAIRLRKQLLRDLLGGLTVSKGRTFKIELHVEREKVGDGDIRLDIRSDDDLDSLRTSSRGEGAKTTIFWAFDGSGDDAWDALTELHRSAEMIDRHDNPSQTDGQRTLLTEERRRRDRARKRAEQLVARDLLAGTVVFDGTTEEVPSGELRPAAEKVVANQLGRIYPHLDEYSASFKKAEVLQILQADSLDGLPDQCGPDGLGIVRMTPAGPELVTDAGPIRTLVDHLDARKRFGEDQNGGQLERLFGGPPYGAPTEVIQAVLAAAMRAGLIEVVSQASRITSASDRRLEQVFGNLPKFRAASFAPASEGSIDVIIRGEVSEWLGALTGESVSLDVGEIAAAGRDTFGPLRQPCTEIRSTLRGAGLVVPDVVTVMDELLGRVASDDDELAVETMHQRRADLEQGRTALDQLAQLVATELDTLTKASAVSRSTDAESAAPEEVAALAELLAAARFADDLAQIKSLTTKAEDASSEARATARTELDDAVADAVEQLRESYPTLADDAFDDAVAPIRRLRDGDGLAVLRANRQAIAGAVAAAADDLDQRSTTRTVVPISASKVWSGAITSEEDLEAALARLREAVVAELGPDTEVRFR